MTTTWSDNPTRNATLKLYNEIDRTCVKLFNNGMSIKQVKAHLESKGIEISEYVNVVIEAAWICR